MSIVFLSFYHQIFLTISMEIKRLKKLIICMANITSLSTPYKNKYDDVTNIYIFIPNIRSAADHFVCWVFYNQLPISFVLMWIILCSQSIIQFLFIFVLYKVNVVLNFFHHVCFQFPFFTHIFSFITHLVYLYKH